MKIIYIFVSILLVAALITGFSACSAPQPEARPGFSPAVCLKTTLAPGDAYKIIEPSELISKEEAAAIVGTVLDGERSEQPSVGKKTILYKAQDNSGSLEISISQPLFFNNGCHTPESIYMSLKAAEDLGIKAQGVGDEYYFSDDSLNMLKDGYYISVSVKGAYGLPGALVSAGALALGNLETAIETRQKGE